MIAVDSPILMDLLGNSAQADAAESCLRRALASGPVVVCDVVVGEITAGLGHGAEVMDVLEDMGVQFSAIEQRTAVRAGEMQRKYLQRAQAKTATPMRAIPEFMVGAHAMLQCNALITRNEQFFRDYFKGLKLISP